ncbi:MAG: hypothetical protein PF484_13090 [Bacteroidales bacterium]|jgi:hypothetical protein|nr:hypothetical protein [Bacteroidales bacterium]
MIDNLYKQIIYNFSYTDSESFIYLKDYSVAIKEYLLLKKLEKRQIIRYMLIGFWIDYLSDEHHGDDFSTIIHKREKLINEENIDEFKTLFGDKLFDEFGNKIETKDMTVEDLNFSNSQKEIKDELYNKFVGTPIMDTAHYLRLLGYNGLDSISGAQLYDFVIKSKKLS